MNRLEHFKEAEKLLDDAQTIAEHAPAQGQSEAALRALPVILQRAQVHATLACAEVPGR